MRSNFKPIHLQEANAMLQKHYELLHTRKKETEVRVKESMKRPSFWRRFLKLFG